MSLAGVGGWGVVAFICPKITGDFSAFICQMGTFLFFNNEMNKWIFIPWFLAHI